MGGVPRSFFDVFLLVEVSSRADSAFSATTVPRMAIFSPFFAYLQLGFTPPLRKNIETTLFLSNFWLPPTPRPMGPRPFSAPFTFDLSLVFVCNRHPPPLARYFSTQNKPESPRFVLETSDPGAEVSGSFFTWPGFLRSYFFWSGFGTDSVSESFLTLQWPFRRSV